MVRRALRRRPSGFASSLERQLSSQTQLAREFREIGESVGRKRKAMPPIARVIARRQFVRIDDLLEPLCQGHGFQFRDGLLHARVEGGERLHGFDVQRDHEMAGAAAMLGLVGAVNACPNALPVRTPESMSIIPVMA